MIVLEPKLTYTVRTTSPLAPVSSGSGDPMQYWQISEATLSGSGIDARLAATGSDWMRVGEDGFWRPDVRVQFETADGAIILMGYRGLVEQTDRFKQAAEADEPTTFEDHYMRLAVEFSTDAPLYGWLRTSLFVAIGRLLGTGRIEYLIYRVA